MRINELEVNMQAVCCLLLYTSQPIGFHQKWRWIVLPKARNNAAQCFIYLKLNSKTILMDLICTLISIWNILFISFSSMLLIFIFKWMRWWWSNMVYGVCCVISHLYKQTANMCFYYNGRKGTEPCEVVAHWCETPTPPQASCSSVGGFTMCNAGHTGTF